MGWHAPGGAGDGTVTEIESTDGTLAVTNPTGPTVNISATPLLTIIEANFPQFASVNNFINSNTFTGAGGASVPLTVNAPTGQAGHLQNWEVNGSTVCNIGSGGNISSNGPIVSLDGVFTATVASGNSVFGTVVGGNIIHLVSTQVTEPTATAEAGATSAVMVAGSTDIKGGVLITTAAGVAIGTVLAEVTYTEVYASTPFVFLSVQDSNAVSVHVKSGSSATLFQIIADSAIASAQSTQVNYWVSQ
jgi:hypothetical protein